MNYKTESLGEIAQVIDSLHKTPKYDDTGTYYMARATDIKYGYLNLENMLTVNEVVYADFTKRYKPSYGDIIITRVGSYGNTAFVNNTNFCLGQNTAAIIPKINNKYLFYVLNSKFIRNQIESFVVGTTQKTLSLKLINALQIPRLTPFNEDRIAHILSTLDDKIELNRKMNQTLEDMAQALFKSWFVDFDPVKAKAKCSSDEELEVVAKELGISKEILELFPSEFEDSELGMIPKGWEAKSFGTLLSKTIGGDWGKEEADAKHTEKVKIIRGTDIPKIKQMSIDAVPTRYVESKKLKTREVFDGDIIIEVSGGTKNQPTGRTLYITNEVINMLDGKVEPASFCRLFRPINKEIGLILGQHMLYIYAQGKTWQYQNQSTGISNFQTTIFLDKEYVVVPDINILTKFYDIIRPLIEQSLSSENITLQKTRDTLLPKLLSGEIEVSDIEVEI